ncbi:DUF6152 family protein [Methylomonas sp. BW4-1]|uniref:DUF6152 family protein n=1 Tax=Methylomonas sp. BW4-1 TaxID=3376685 RepID=UPI0040416B1A
MVTAEWCVGTSQPRGGADEACSGAHGRLRRTAEHFVDAPIAPRGTAKAFGGAAGSIFGAHARLGHTAGIARRMLCRCCDVKQTDGSAKNWGFEFGAPFSLKQKGITKASLPVGSEVTIQGYRAKNGKDFGYAVTTVLSDGRSVKTGGAQDAPGAQANGQAQ